MAIRYTIEKHAECFTSKVLAADYGAHIFNIKLTSDTDNGNIIGRGDWLGLDLYEETTAPAGFTAVVREQAANGNWYVEVTANPNHALLVRQTPINAEEWTNNFKKESNFFNLKDDVVRAYDLVVGDIFEVSAEAFSGTPVAEATISSITNKKLTIG